MASEEGGQTTLPLVTASTSHWQLLSIHSRLEHISRQSRRQRLHTMHLQVRVKGTAHQHAHGQLAQRCVDSQSAQHVKMSTATCCTWLHITGYIESREQALKKAFDMFDKGE
jgi:hypothetical protein